MQKIVVDRSKCTGLGICESIAPAYFEVDDSGDLVLIRDTVDPADEAEVEHAISTCPTLALSRK